MKYFREKIRLVDFVPYWLIRKLLEVSELEQELTTSGDHLTMLKQVFRCDSFF